MFSEDMVKEQWTETWKITYAAYGTKLSGVFTWQIQKR